MRPVLLAVLLALGGWLTMAPAPTQPTPDPANPDLAKKPAPVCPGPLCPVKPVNPTPQPEPAQPTKPKRPLRPWLQDPETPCVSPCPAPPKDRPVIGKISLGGSTSPNGEEVTIDFPLSQWMKNRGGRDGAGMCVATSIEHSLRWAGREEYRGFRDWAATFTGGGWPSRVDWYFREYPKLKKLPKALYIQYEGKDVTLLKLALKTGRMPAITYAGKDGVRYKGPIAHMVNIIHFSENEVCLMDNNGGKGEFIWLNPHEFVERWYGGRNGWAVIPLYPGPALPPVNDIKSGKVKPWKIKGGDGATLAPAWQPIHYVWSKEKEGSYNLYVRNGGLLKEVGRYEDGKYREKMPPDSVDPWWYDFIEWSDEKAPPVSPPFVPLTGLVWSNIGSDERYSINGADSTREIVIAALRKVEAKRKDAKKQPKKDENRRTFGQLVDDSAKLKVTVIGSPAEQEMVKKDLNESPELAVFQEKIVVRFCSPDDWMLKDLNFVTTGKPTIYVQASGDFTRDAGAKPLHRQDAYYGATHLAEVLGEAFGKLRKPQPYDPSKDPDLSKKPTPQPTPNPSPAVSPSSVPDALLRNRQWSILGVIGGIAWLLLGGKRPQ